MWKGSMWPGTTGTDTAAVVVVVAAAAAASAVFVGSWRVVSFQTEETNNRIIIIIIKITRDSGLFFFFFFLFFPSFVLVRGAKSSAGPFGQWCNLTRDCVHFLSKTCPFNKLSKPCLLRYLSNFGSHPKNGFLP